MGGGGGGGGFIPTFPVIFISGSWKYFETTVEIIISETLVFFRRRPFSQSELMKCHNVSHLSNPNSRYLAAVIYFVMVLFCLFVLLLFVWGFF